MDGYYPRERHFPPAGFSTRTHKGEWEGRRGQERAHQCMREPSMPPDTKSSSWCGCHVTAVTSRFWPLYAASARIMRMSKTRHSWSREPVSSQLPLLFHCTLVTAFLCPWMLYTHLPALGSHSFTCSGGLCEYKGKSAAMMEFMPGMHPMPSPADCLTVSPLPPDHFLRVGSSHQRVLRARSQQALARVPVHALHVAAVARQRLFRLALLEVPHLPSQANAARVKSPRGTSLIRTSEPATTHDSTHNAKPLLLTTSSSTFNAELAAAPLHARKQPRTPTAQGRASVCLDIAP